MVIVTIVTRLKYPGQCGDVVVWGSHLLRSELPQKHSRDPPMATKELSSILGRGSGECLPDQEIWGLAKGEHADMRT